MVPSDDAELLENLLQVIAGEFFNEIGEKADLGPQSGSTCSTFGPVNRMRQYEAIQQMTHLGTLSAIGKLWDENKDLGPVDYQIEVFRSDGLKRGEGTLRCGAIGLLNRFRAGQPLMLMLRTGEQVSVTIKNPGDLHVDIFVTGPIPDPVNYD